MVEHMSGQTTQDAREQSLNGAPALRWYQRSHHHQRHLLRELDAPVLLNVKHLANSTTASIDSTTSTNTSSNTATTSRFSLFSWFRRRNNGSSSSSAGGKRQLFRRVRRRSSSTSSTSSASSASSNSSLYSTATVRSFAFHSGARHPTTLQDALLRLEQSSSAVGPFAPGAVKLVDRCRPYQPTSQLVPAASSVSTATLPSAFSQRQHIEARYSLLPASSSFVSYDSIPLAQRQQPKPTTHFEIRSSPKGLSVLVIEATGDQPASDSSLGAASRKLHVKGKRRAPEPPAPRSPSVHVSSASPEPVAAASRARARRKRRPAPKPPGYSDTLSSNQDSLSSGTSTAMDTFAAQPKEQHCLSNDTLVLRRGVLLSKRESRSSSSGPASDSSRTPNSSVGESEANNSSAGGKLVLLNGSAAARLPELNAAKLIMPRPWYKRNGLGEHSPNRNSRDSSTSGRRTTGGDVLRVIRPSQSRPDKPEENLSSTSASSTLSSTTFPFEGSLSRLSFFQRGSDRSRHDDSDDKKKKDSKRVSILMNISELDKEAAAIVQAEQARNRASMMLQAARMDEDFERRMGVNEEIVQEIVNSSMESSPRPRSTRALISKFNALGNITRVGLVNSSLFKSSNSPKAKVKRFSQQETSANGQRLFTDPLPPVLGESRTDGSSKYCAKQQQLPRRESAAIFTEVVKPGGTRSGIDEEAKPLKVTVTRSSATQATSAAPTNATKMPASTQPPAGKDDIDLVRSLAAELDDVATGIARLRRELDNRPKMIENIDKVDEEIGKATKADNASANADQQANRNKSKRQDLANIDKEFTKIFDEIDKQLKGRDTKIVMEKKRNTNATVAPPTATTTVATAGVNGNSMASQVAKVIDILVSADKEAATSRKDIGKVDVDKRAPARTSVVRISGVDDKTTAELKEMIKEMKHSLPKRPRAKPTAEEKPAAIIKAPTTKVSSAVQTSGNVRKIEPAESPRAELAGEYVELGQPRRLPVTESTYVNVMEKSLYANAQVPAARKSNVDSQRLDQVRGTAARRRIDDNERAGENLEEIKKQYMNTLAVNRLLKKLEAAIAAGHHQQAANLAKELAQLKIQCCVSRQQSNKPREKINLSLYIEDKQAHQGPIPLQLPINMTVAQLKAKIHIEFEIPGNVQRWIIGKNLADNDESTLEELQAVEGSPVFLYLVAPPPPPADLQDKEAIKPDKQRIPENEEVEEERKKPQEMEIVAGNKEPEQGVINEKNDEQIHEIKAEIEPLPVQLELRPAAEAKVEPQASKEEEEVRLKEEKLKRYEELMSLENCDVIANSEPIECPVCFMIFPPGEGVILRDCLHSFCRICVGNVVRYCEEAEVKCPYRDADYTCESTLQEREIKALVPPEVYQQHLAKSIAQAENNAGNNAFHCKTPDCPGWCIYDDNVNNFLCPVCKANNCLTCQAIHMGKNCRQYQEELKHSKESDHESKRTAAMLEEMVDRGEALACPTCAVVLMKKWGCDWLRCSMCKTEICWVTRGPRWGPAGKGDTSGGCRCGENGVKCHPRCNYCH